MKIHATKKHDWGGGFVQVTSIDGCMGTRVATMYAIMCDRRGWQPRGVLPCRCAGRTCTTSAQCMTRYFRDGMQAKRRDKFQSRLLAAPAFEAAFARFGRQRSTKLIWRFANAFASALEVPCGAVGTSKAHSKMSSSVMPAAKVSTKVQPGWR